MQTHERPNIRLDQDAVNAERMLSYKGQEVDIKGT